MNVAAPLLRLLPTIGIDRVLSAVDYPFEDQAGTVAAFDAIAHLTKTNAGSAKSTYGARSDFDAGHSAGAGFALPVAPSGVLDDPDDGSHHPMRPSAESASRITSRRNSQAEISSGACMQIAAGKLTTALVSSLDPFGREFLEDPLPCHEMLRDAAPVLWLEKYGLWALARYEHVHAALNDWQTFCSRRGVGLSDFAREKPWRPPSLLLEADPPLHTRTRGAIVKLLSRPALANLQAGFEVAAERLVDRVLQLGSFDGVTELAQAFPLSVFPDAVGVSPEGRENLLPYGEMAFNAFGPRNWLFEESM